MTSAQAPSPTPSARVVAWGTDPRARWLTVDETPAVARRLAQTLAALDGASAVLLDPALVDPPYPRRPRLAHLAPPGAPACPVAAWACGYAPLGIALFADGRLGSFQAANTLNARIPASFPRVAARDVARAPSPLVDPLARPALGPRPQGPAPWRTVWLFARLPLEIP